MLVVGKVGWGPTLAQDQADQGRTAHAHHHLGMVAAPLLIGCDMSDLDQWTLDLLTNDDVLAVDQDPLGKAATVKAKSGRAEIWARPLFDRTIAVALFNKSDTKQEVTADWKDLGVSGSQPVRDLWQRKDLGSFDGSFKISVLPHCAVLVKIGKPQE